MIPPDAPRLRAELPPRAAAELVEAAAAARLLYQSGARQVWICGSLAHGQHWDERSDLDFVTAGLPPVLRAGLTMTLTALTGRKVDVIPLEDAPPFLRVQIVQAMIPIDRFGRTAATTYGLRNPPVATLSRRPLPRGLHARRHAAVAAVIGATGARRIVDIGCGAGALVTSLVVGPPGADVVLGLDPDPAAVADARQHVAATLTGDRRRQVRIERGGIDDLADHWPGHDALVAVEVLEHLDTPVLDRLAPLVFGLLQPAVVVFTTPNADFNALLPGRGLRHREHRFEWTRRELTDWAAACADLGGYRFSVSGVGEPHPDHGSPSQIVSFVRRRAA